MPLHTRFEHSLDAPARDPGDADLAVLRLPRSAGGSSRNVRPRSAAKLNVVLSQASGVCGNRPAREPIGRFAWLSIKLAIAVRALTHAPETAYPIALRRKGHVAPSGASSRA